VREIVFDRQAREYAMILDGEHIGFARTYHEGEVTLDALVREILLAYVSSPAQPLPPVEVVEEALDELSAIPTDDTPHFAEARAQLASGIPLVADGATLWVDAVQVTPNPACVGWPWRCACEEARCWHAALAEGVALARERWAEAQDEGELSFALAA
jgi:hypothetical protein